MPTAKNKVLHIYQLKVFAARKKAVLDLNKFFYPKKTIEKTAKAFKDVCKTKCEEKQNRFVVQLFFPNKQGIKKNALAFANYALALSKEMR